MEVVSFRWWGRFGHFLQADAGATAFTYPLPPRTAALGVVAAVLGLEKDALAVELVDAQVAIQGPAPRRFWHRAKLRKTLPSPLPFRVQANQRGSETDEKPTLVNQEWLIAPDYLVHLAFPEKPDLVRELAERLQERRWCFTPCLGLSEMLADLALIARQQARALSAGQVEIQGACPADAVTLLRGEGLGLHLLRMPHHVSPDRVFTHRSYYLEREGRPFPVRTAAAWMLEQGSAVIFS